MAPSLDDEALKAMKYRDLQKIAKEVGVKANLARPLLIQKILEAKFPTSSVMAAGPADPGPAGDTAAHQRPPAEAGRHQVPHQEGQSSDEDSDTPEGKEADRQLLRMDQEIRKKGPVHWMRITM